MIIEMPKKLIQILYSNCSLELFLKEALEVIKFYSDENSTKAKDFLEKWGIIECVHEFRKSDSKSVEICIKCKSELRKINKL